MKLTAIIVLLSSMALAQGMGPGPGVKSYAASSPAIQQVGTWKVAYCTSTNCTATTAALNTTGATLLVIVASAKLTTDINSVGDSKSNSWQALTEYKSITNGVQIYYVCGPTTDTAQTVHASGAYAIIFFSAWKNTQTSACVDGSGTGNHLTTNGATIAPGSLTPAAANDLYITAATSNATLGAASVDSSFSTATLQTNSSAEVGAVSSLIATDALAKNPTWTLDVLTIWAAALAAFQQGP